MGFQQGLSGLSAASRSLDVIGHNIANANTTGFKSSRAEFADMVAASMGAASGRSNGIGVEVAAVAQQFTQGSLTVTGNNLDLAINGNGFFKVQQPDGSAAYTRAGNFKLDKAGDLVTNDGSHVMGYKVDPATGVAGTETVPLSFPVGSPIGAKQTTSITASFNLDARAKDAAGVTADPTATPPVAAVAPTPRSTYGTSVNVFDSQGVATPLSLYFVKTAEPNTWEVYTSLDETLEPPGSPKHTITFNEKGEIVADSAKLTLEVTPSANPNTDAPGPFEVEIDFGKVTQFGNKFAVSDLKQDGYGAGELTNINVANDGTIVASYSNGVTRAEAQVALANFRNPQGLTPVGGNNWVETFESGPSMLGKPGDGNFGVLRSGALEESNVDLTAELVNMMTAQRAYQANAQTIKTQDQAMSTIVNLR